MALSASDALNYGDQASAALNGSLASVQGANRQLQNTLAEEDKAMKPAMQRFNQIASQPIPAPPEPKKASPAPDYQQFQKDSQGWISALAAFSALIGARGRSRGTGALKAYAAGLNGIQQGNQTAFKNAYEKWKGESEEMLKENQQEMDKYKSIIENRELSESEAAQQLKLVGMEYQNRVMAGSENAHQAFAVYDSMVKARANAEVYIDKIDKKAKEQQQQYEKTKEDYKKDTASQTQLSAYMGGQKPVLSGYGMIRQAKQDALDEMAHDKDPNWDFNTAQAKRQAFMQGAGQLGKQAETVNFASNELDKSLPSLMAITQKYQLGNFKTANEAYRYMQDKYPTSEDFKNFDTQMRAVKSAYALFIGRGASRGTVHSDEEAGKITDTDMGTLSMAGFIQGVNTERKNALEGINTTMKNWFETKGGTAAPFNTESTPAAGAPAGGAAPKTIHFDDLPD